MNTFLGKISQLEAVCEVVFLSRQGELLFHRKAGGAMTADTDVAMWNAVIDNLGRPAAAEFLFSKGRYYLHDTEIGVLIVGMFDDKSLKKIRSACTNVQEKLIGGAVCKKILLKMLDDGAEAVKPNIIKALSPFADGEVVRALVFLLQQRETFPPSERGGMLLSLCRTLGKGITADALPELRKVMQAYSSDESPEGRAIKDAAWQAVRQLESTLPAGAKDSVVRTAGPSVQKSGEEQQVHELAERGEKRQAISLLMELIAAHARARRFRKAEQLRDWLMQIDSMALVESIRAAEIIEEEKGASISEEYLQVWKGLVDALSTQEFASLYHAATQRTYTEGEMVAKQGDFLSTLFFVNSGRVQMYVVSQGREVPLKSFGPGEIFGIDTFFDVSVWTVNVVSRGASLSLLSWQGLQDQKENCPALKAKLQAYCARFASPNALFAKTHRTRRQSERKKVTGRITLDLLDQDGKHTGLGAKGDLIDLSSGGVAISLRFSRKKNANAFLEQKIRVNMRPDSSSPLLQSIGKVMAVRCHDFVGNDYSLHVQFDKELTSEEVQQILSRGR